MENKIATYSQLEGLVCADPNEHGLKQIAKLFLTAMNDWPTYNQLKIAEFIKEFKEYFGVPLTIKKIKSKRFDKHNGWQMESGGSIADLLDISERFCNQPDFDKIVELLLDYYGSLSLRNYNS